MGGGAVARRLAPLLAAMLVALAGPARADPVAVRSGEHPTFTRLVIPIAAGAAWTLEPAPGGYALGLPEGTEYDLAGVFDRVPRNRLGGLEAEGAALRLALACDCHAAAFVHDGSHLVVDVIDGPPPSGTAPPGPALVEEIEAAGTAVTEAAILEGFARAASQGLLDLAPGGGGAEALAGPVPPGAGPHGAPRDAHDAEGDHGGHATAASPAAPPPGPVSPAPSSPAADALAPRPGLTLRTSVDRGPQPGAAPLADAGASCIADADLDLAGWSGTGDFAGEIAARASALTTERDLTSEGAAEAMARTYIAFGFGREAGRALSLDGRRSTTRDRLALLARLVDGEAAPPGALADQGGCLGAVALWRALARGDVTGTDERERTAMALALRALPDAVRGHLAVRLSGLLLRAGDAGAARAALAMAEGTPTGAGTAAAQARARVAAVMEGPAAAARDLAAIAASDARLPPDGLVDLLDLTLMEGGPVGDDLILLLRAARFEHRGSPEAPGLLLAEARALTAALRFEEALGLLEGDGGLLPAAEARDARAATVEALARDADDALFLSVALSRLPEGLAYDAVRPVADRLRALGFGPEADALMVGPGGAGDRSAGPRPGDGAAPVPPRPRARPAAPPVPTLAPAEAADGPRAEVAAVEATGAPPAPITPPAPIAPPAPDDAEAAPTSTPPAAAPMPIRRIVSDDAPPARAAPASTAAFAPPGVAPDPASGAAPGAAASAALTLADRQALLDRAAAARDQARALLDDESPGGS